MASYVIDLEIVQVDGEPWFQFRWQGGDWYGALQALKERVPPEARSYDPETRLWRVGDIFESDLCAIFPNFESSLDAIRSQLSFLI